MWDDSRKTLALLLALLISRRKEKKKKKKKKETSLTPMNLCTFCKHPSNIINISLWCIKISFHSMYPLPSNISVKLNEKIRKMIKGILVILHIYVGI
jgi:hypothetical protein